MYVGNTVFVKVVFTIFGKYVIKLRTTGTRYILQSREGLFSVQFNMKLYLIESKFSLLNRIE